MKLLNLCSPEIGLVFRVFYYVGILGQIVEDSIQNNDMVRILEEGWNKNSILPIVSEKVSSALKSNKRGGGLMHSYEVHSNERACIKSGRIGMVKV